jgi:hypothetical protein
LQSAFGLLKDPVLQAEKALSEGHDPIGTVLRACEAVLRKLFCRGPSDRKRFDGVLESRIEGDSLPFVQTPPGSFRKELKMRRGKHLLALIVATMSIATVQPAMVFSSPQSGDVAATVTYTGKGKVDETHEIWVFLFETPNIEASSQPIAVASITKSGGTATFKDITPERVYIAVTYDEKGDYDGKGPPFGLPTAMYSKDGKTNDPITPGPKGKVKLTFDDSSRLGPPK